MVRPRILKRSAGRHTRAATSTFPTLKLAHQIKGVTTAMQVNEAHRIRNGLKSCTECRRRKVRCIRVSEHALACRNCEKRGLECRPQDQGPPASRRVSSRQRIFQLESQVSGLIKQVHRIESKLAGQEDSASEMVVSHPSPEMNTSDNESNMSDIFATEQPSHMQSLFQNGWLTLDSRQKYGQVQERRERASANLLNTARETLQKLIPPKHEVVEMYQSTFEWLRILHALLPQPFIARSQADALGNYDRMKKPDVDTMALASWMLTLAITAQQTPQDGPPTPEKSRKWLKQFELSRAISDAVESTIISHDRLLGTTTGLMLCMHWTRLQMSQGNYHKSWVRLRNVCAVAELMGLPRAFRASQRNGLPTRNDEVQLEKAQLWEMISALDRLLGMILNLPPDTRWHRHVKDEAMTVDGVVQPRPYFTKLVNIAGKVQALDELNMARENIAELSKSTFELVEELRSLASQTQESWWTQPMERIEPDNIVQAVHHYLLLRTYMPLTLRQDSSEELFNLQLACFGSCESVIRRYAILLEALPPGFFFYTTMELHIFTATVILVLLSHTSKTSQHFSLRVDKARTEWEVQKVIAIMRKGINNTPTSRVAESAVRTLSSLTHLLQDNENVTEGRKVMLDVPLLGKVHIQRNVRTPAITTMEEVEPSRSSLRSALRTPSHQPPHPSLGLNAASSSRQDIQQTHDLSWFIEEDPAYFLQDMFMVDTFDQNGLLYNGSATFFVN